MSFIFTQLLMRRLSASDRSCHCFVMPCILFCVSHTQIVYVNVTLARSEPPLFACAWYLQVYTEILICQGKCDINTTLRQYVAPRGLCVSHINIVLDTHYKEWYYNGRWDSDFGQLVMHLVKVVCHTHDRAFRVQS
jgi:hypothetical protein